MKCLTILDALPQFIQAARVSRAFQNILDIQEILIDTRQHYDQNMSVIFFRDLAIPKPQYNLYIGSGIHNMQRGTML